jgi:hypothetical protein
VMGGRISLVRARMTRDGSAYPALPRGKDA